MKQKICALVLILALLAGCTANEVSDQQFDIAAQRQQETSSAVSEPKAAEPVTEIRLAYDVNDSLNPYRMTSEANRRLTPLLYDSLTRTGKNFQPENQLAQEVTVSGTLCTVKFNRRTQFSDGTLLTGKDIVYSIQTAKNSDTNYRTMLENVVSSEVNAEDDVLIHLNRPDVDFAALLSFPIIKEGTADADYPTGASKFYLSGTSGTTGGILSANHLYYADAGPVKTIYLVHVSDPEGQAFSLKSGEIDLAYSDLSGTEFSGTTGLSVPVTLNNLVYLGVNANRGLLARAEFRQAISAALNRDELISKAWAGRAEASRYPFNPEFYRMSGMELSTPRNLTQADALLDGLGLTQKDADGYRTVNGGPVTLTLLVNNANTYRNAAATLISEQLRQIGVKVDLVSQSFDQYEQSVRAGSYDLYIGETRLMENMDLSPLLGGGSLGIYAARSEELDTLHNAYKETGAGIETLCEGFLKELPFIPLAFRQGIVSYNRDFGAEIVATEQDIFYNIVEW